MKVIFHFSTLNLSTLPRVNRTRTHTPIPSLHHGIPLDRSIDYFCGNYPLGHPGEFLSDCGSVEEPEVENMD